uniref:Alkaline shock response membrane anchor protein AmaP n=1 Tax=Thermogemmatispora argillosa TaxID=2045280 RepID=A0A455T4Q4_9CHLR|nr:hypothetical protein KTA_31770 [Thermogemmatispora argillosa]
MRNIFNRLLILLLSLAALVVGVALILLEAGLVTAAQVSPGGFLLRQWEFLSHLNQADATTATLVGVGLALVGLILLIVELLPGKRPPAQFVIQHDSRGMVAVTRSSVNELVRYVAGTVPGILETRGAVRQEQQGLRVRVQAAIAPDVAAPEVGKTLQEKLQQTLQHHLGLPVARVEIATQVASPGRGRRVR